MPVGEEREGRSVGRRRGDGEGYSMFLSSEGFSSLSIWL